MDFQLLAELRNEERTHLSVAYFDLSEHAARLERGYGHYFKEEPKTKLYFDHVAHAIIDLEKEAYFTLPLAAESGKGKQLHTLADILAAKGNIWNKDHNVIVSAKAVSFLREKPTMAVRMMDFIVDYIRDYTKSRIPPLARLTRMHDFNELLSAALNPKWLTELQEETQVVQDDFYNEVFYCIEPLMGDVREFLGPNKWMIHYIDRQEVDLKIEKMVDYRIYIYHERMEAELMDTGDQ